MGSAEASVRIASLIRLCLDALGRAGDAWTVTPGIVPPVAYVTDQCERVQEWQQEIFLLLQDLDGRLIERIGVASACRRDVHTAAAARSSPFTETGAEVYVHPAGSDDVVEHDWTKRRATMHLDGSECLNCGLRVKMELDDINGGVKRCGRCGLTFNTELVETPVGWAWMTTRSEVDPPPTSSNGGPSNEL